MDRLERVHSPVDTMLAAFDGLQSKMWTALPGIVQSFNAADATCTVQPAIQAQVQAADGSLSWVSLPLLVKCPVVFPRGGGCSLTFPVTAGDECLVIFASRCIDAWWQSGGVQVQAELRMHDLSDGFALLGVSSVPNVPASISTSAVELRSNDGNTKISLNPTTKAVEVDALTLTLNVANITVNGNMAVTGSLSNNGVNIGNTHVHGGVTTGTGNTAGPH